MYNVDQLEFEHFMRNNFASKSKTKERRSESSTVARLETTILPAIYRRFISRNAYDRFPTKTWSSRKWIPTYRLAGTNRSHYAARSSPILMARRKSDRFATCASNTRFHARFQIMLIFSASCNDVLSLILLLDKYPFFTILFLFFSLFLYTFLIKFRIPIIFRQYQRISKINIGTLIEKRRKKKEKS